VEPVSSIPVLDQPREQLQHLKEGRPVPSTRIGRAAGFARLGLGLAWGAAAEGASRLLFSPKDAEGASGGLPSSASSPLSASSIVATDANSDRLASTLCRMRGAALKMGQMLSIQDESLLPAGLQRALRQVRQGAEAMPRYQLERQMESQLGKHWRDRFERFDDLPFAAASIGQVHRAAVRANGSFGGRPRDVVVKVQYPGVARSIKSDLRNLSMLVTLTGMAPPGLFIENVIRVGEQELSVECDYRRELVNQRRVKGLVEADPVLRENRFAVPDAVPELSTDEILTSEYRPGGTIDKVSHLSQEERNRIGRTIMYLTMKELFVWRFMQTDPNWGNFLYDVGSGTTSLIDFGATREYSKSFVDGYLRIVWASANRDEAALMEQSYRMNFLTGEETEQMLRAHKLSGYTVGEPFYSNEPFDFRGSNISTRMGEHTSVFLRHRLTPPPEEVYTLHRKLAGAYMLCIKLGAVIECRSMLQDIVASHRFEDGLAPLLP
jgi:aarF domain-containing kinase